MRTSAFVNRVMRVCPSIQRAAVIDEVNNALNIIFDRPLSVMRVYDESTGLDPVLSTVVGQFHYDSDDVSTTADIAYIGRMSIFGSGKVADWTTPKAFTYEAVPGSVP